MRAGFVAIGRADEVELDLLDSPCNRLLGLVSAAWDGSSASVLVGRLHYRNELRAALAQSGHAKRLAEAEAGKAVDAALVLALYHAVGAAGLMRLEGDFALVIWDGKARRLVGLRDPMGGYPLFRTRHGAAVAFATSPRPLLDRLGNAELDPDYLAGFLTMHGQRNEGTGETSVYRDVARIPPGEVIAVDLVTGRIERPARWGWLDRLRQPAARRLPEVAEEYGVVLRAAVGERLQGRTAAHLSGGMDSTGVCLIARDLIDAGYGERPLHSLSLVYRRLAGLARERPYIDAVLDRETAIVAHYLPADDLLDYDSFQDPPLHDEPYAGLWRLAMDRATVSAAAQIGAETLLTGLGADDMMAMLPFHLADLLRQGRLLAAWQQAGAWAQVHDCNPWHILHPFGIVPLAAGRWPDPLRSAAGRSGSACLANQREWSIPPWIRPDFARRHGLAQRARADFRAVYRRCRETVMSVALTSLSDVAGDVLRWSVAVPHGIHLAHPFLDTRLLCLSLGIRRHYQPEPSQMKPVLATALRDLLPNSIRTRRRKGHFNEVYYLGLIRNIPALIQMVEQAPIDHLGLFDKPVLIRALYEASLAGARVRQMQRLDFSLSLIKWLCMQPKWQTVRERPTCSLRLPLGRAAPCIRSGTWRAHA